MCCMATDEGQRETLRSEVEAFLAEGAESHRWEDTGIYGVTIKTTLQHGRFACRELTVEQLDGGPPVTTEGLREISVGELIEKAFRNPVLERELAEAAQAHGMQQMDGGGLELVAWAYRYGNALGDSPTREVMRLCGLSRSKASRWVAAARDRGHLGAALPRLAGEY